MKKNVKGYDEDENLINQYMEINDITVLDVLYTKYYTSVYHICLHYTNKRADALDLTQEIFIRVFEKMDTLKNRKAFASWLFRISRNMCVNYLNKRKEEYHYDMESFSDFEDESYAKENDLNKEILLHKALASIEVLPEITRQILVLKYLEDYSLKELEQKFLLGESAVKMRLLRAKKILKQELINRTNNGAYDTMLVA